MGKCAVRRTALWLRLWFYIIQGFTNALWKSWVQFPNAELGCPRKWHFGIPRNTEVISGAIPAKLRRNHFRSQKISRNSVSAEFRGHPMRNEPFLIVIYHSSLVKGAINAARVCKLRNGVKKTPQFLLFSMAKGGPSAQWISPQLSKLMA